MKIRIENCYLVDETHPLNGFKVSIIVDDGTIALITDTFSENIEVDSVLDFEGAYVSPGWIDIHVHCFQDTTDLGVEADSIGVKQGVVCVIDAGSSGSDTIDTFYHQVKDKKTHVKAWINIAKSGLIDRHELKDPDNIDVGATVEKINQYTDFIVGVKVRASGSVMGEDYKTPFTKARMVLDATRTPMMVHFGNNPPTLDAILEQMYDGDILTHCFHGKPNNILNQNSIKECVLQKREAGVFYDVGHGQDSFSYSIAKKAKALNFEPDSISTDLHKYNVDTPVGSLASVMTKFLALGYSLEKVVGWVTHGPAQTAHLTGFGRVNAGMRANLTFFRVEETAGTLVDSMNESIHVQSMIHVVGCMIDDDYYEVNDDLFEE